MRSWVLVSAVGLFGLVAHARQEEPKPEALAHVLVEGQITDGVGAGQAGVEVTVHRKRDDGSKGELIATGKTDSLGDFKITVSEAVVGGIVVTISKAQFADSVHLLDVKEGDPPPFIGEALKGNLTVSGRVVNALGKVAVPGARVQLKSLAAELEATTDKEGKFRIAGVSPGPMELIVEAERFGRERQDVKQIETFHEKEIVLKPDRVLKLKVIDEGGKPIGGVLVECLDQPRTDFRQGMTDAEGLVTFSGIHFDAFMLGARLSHPDYVSGATFDRQITTPENARESSHEFTMVRAGTITGEITSAASGEALQGARVLVGDEYSDAAPKDWSSHAGTFTIRGVRPGLVTVTVHLAGYAPELKQVTVLTGEPTKLDVPLGAASVIQGVVKDDKGAGVADVELVATEWRSRSTLGLRAMTDASGRFRMENAPSDAFEVMISVPRRAAITRTFQAGKGAVEINLPAAAGGEPRSGPLPVGEVVPELTLKTLEGEPIALGSLRGKTVLVDFWATWCLPCVEEQAHFLAVQERHGGRKDFVILGISRDYEVATVREFLGKNPKIKWAQVVGSAAGVKQACEGFGVTALPEVFLIGPDGKVIANRLRAKHIEDAVDEALKAKSPG